MKLARTTGSRSGVLILSVGIGGMACRRMGRRTMRTIAMMDSANRMKSERMMIAAAVWEERHPLSSCARYRFGLDVTSCCCWKGARSKPSLSRRPRSVLCHNQQRGLFQWTFQGRINMLALQVHDPINMRSSKHLRVMKDCFSLDSANCTCTNVHACAETRVHMHISSPKF